MIGIDEVGRGCWAGPLVVAAARQVTNFPTGIKDSKVLSQRQRVTLLPKIYSSCQLGIGWAWPSEIDEISLSGALRLAAARALYLLKVEYSEEILIDGKINIAPPEFLNVSCLVDGDAENLLIGAASIAAKEARDIYMNFIAEKYPNYGFERHVGYGTLFHRTALKDHGPIRGVHRFCFAPIRRLNLGI